jgi:DNA adenine methylase
MDGRIRPPLKWAGGKRWLVKQIEHLWEPYKKRNYRFLEPFCGGLAVTLGLMPKLALLNDINPHLINLYLQLKRGLKADLPMRFDKGIYYDYRRMFNGLIKEGKWKTPEAARLFYYLNHSGYNGLCRFNKQGYFNVPVGEYKQVTYMKEFDQYRFAFEKWDFSCEDFEKVRINANDFLYVDPPYDVEFRQYSEAGFDWKDQVRLAKWIADRIDRRVPVVISNQATERIVKLYSDMGFKLEFLDAPRMISCKGDRTRAKEVLATRGL